MDILGFIGKILTISYDIINYNLSSTKLKFHYQCVAKNRNVAQSTSIIQPDSKFVITKKQTLNS